MQPHPRQALTALAVPFRPLKQGGASLKDLLGWEHYGQRRISFSPALEAAMVDFRTPAAAILLVGLTLSVAAAESSTVEDLSSDTATQHHLWSQKFDTILEPETTGSIVSPTISGMDTTRLECVPAGLAFSNPPFPDWHIGSCS